MLIRFLSCPQSNSSTTSLKEGIDTAKAMLGEILAHLPAARASSTASFSLDSFGTVSACAPPLAQPFVSDPTPAKVTPLTVAESLPLPVQAPPLQSTRSITLKHTGITVTFTEADVVDPPALRFAVDIPHLNQMWDDDPIHWRGDSPLIIKGVPIPLVYWKQVYYSKGRPWRQGNWKGIKGQWFNWKVSNRAMHHPDPFRKLTIFALL